MPEPPFKIAAVQASPVVLDREATVEKACGLIAEAGAEGARLIVFPETFIPTYPDWVWALAPADGDQRRLYAQLIDQSVSIPSPTIERLCTAAREAGAYVVMGINERNDEASGGSLYNTLVYINDGGELIGKHRKLVPTGAERMVWAQGDGSTLGVYDTSLGKLGGLICWENYMPLARYAMYAWGTQIYVAPTWDHSEPWLSTLRHIATEGRCYVVGVCIALRKGQVPDGVTMRTRDTADDGEEWINSGTSAIVGPGGKFLAGPVAFKEEILYAEVEPERIDGSHWELDVAGHYARPDVFQLTINSQPWNMLGSNDAVAPSAVAPASSPSNTSD